MSGRTVLLLLGAMLAGVVLQAALAVVLALRSPLGEPGFDTGELLSFYRNPTGYSTDWPRPSDPAGQRALSMALGMWPFLAEPAVEYQEFSIQYWEGVGVAFGSGFADKKSGARVRFQSQRYESGWPLHSMRADIQLPGGLRWGVDLPVSWLAGDRKSMFVHWSLPPVRAVAPLRPIVIGTIINSSLFSFVIAAVGFALMALVRRIRGVRGVCAHCGYSRAGLPREDAPCPECGRAPRARARKALS